MPSNIPAPSVFLRGRRRISLTPALLVTAAAALAPATGCRSGGTTTSAELTAGQSGSVAPMDGVSAGAGAAAPGTAGAAQPAAGTTSAPVAGSTAPREPGGSAGAAGSNEAGSGGGAAGMAGTAGDDGAAGAAGAAGDDGASGAPAAGSGGMPAGPVDYGQRGPYEVTIEKNVGGTAFRNSNVTDQSGFCAAFVGGISLPGEGNVDEELTNYPADMDRQLYTMFRPATLMEGKKYPLITWGNGTCAQPLLYTEILEHLASHGMIVIATNATSVGSGREMLRGVEFVLAENQREGSPLFGKIDPERIGASGHSQGSGATVTVGADARIKVTVPIQGGSAAGVRALKGPTFLISGETDTLVTPASVESAFNAATVPAVYGMSVGQDHLMPGRMPQPILEGVTAWFAIHLLADQEARPLFYGEDCGLCDDPAWTIERRNL